jgi:hypothetical protein
LPQKNILHFSKKIDLFAFFSEILYGEGGSFLEKMNLGG